MNFHVELAEDGEAGYDKVCSADFDLILLDLMMPRVNGYEFIEKMKSIPSPAKRHIIVFTAAGQRGVDKIPPHSVCNSILKPFDLGKFLDMIQECFSDKH